MAAISRIPVNEGKLKKSTKDESASEQTPSARNSQRHRLKAVATSWWAKCGFGANTGGTPTLVSGREGVIRKRFGKVRLEPDRPAPRPTEHHSHSKDWNLVRPFDQTNSAERVQFQESARFPPNLEKFNENKIVG